MIRFIRFALAALAAAGCATSPPTTASQPQSAPASIIPTETGVMIRLPDDGNAVTVGVNAAPDKVWSLLPGIYETLGITAEVRDSAARRFGTTNFTLGRLDGRRTTDFVRCGNEGTGPSSAGMYRRRLSILSSIGSSADGTTSLTTEVSGTATPVEGTSSSTLTCTSTGGLEQRIRALLLQRLTG